ncbi:MAG TPA: GTPase ObgE, partial [Candidatus Cloacimonadota bacterium]|nr:GTPase ObgE [Candidatus Cloacimonadota bacterium]
DSFMDKKPFHIVLSKIDTLPDEEREQRLQDVRAIFKETTGEEVEAISAVGNIGLDQLKYTLFRMIQDSRA